MKAILFSDLHIHDYKQFNSDHKRLENCLQVLRDVAKAAHDNDIDTILFVGDLYDTQRALLTRVVNRTVETFVELFKTYPDLYWFGITGNHDQSEKSLYKGVETIPAESALQHIADISEGRFIICDQKVVNIYDEILLAGLPYYEYKEHYEEALKDITKERPDSKLKRYLMIHQTPIDPTGNPMIKTEADPQDEIYGNYDYVFCGHIHQRKQLNDKFLIVGSPIHRDLGDEGEKKGYLIFDFDTDEYEFVYLDAYPEYKQVYRKDHEEGRDGGDYVVVKPDPEVISSSMANAENFSVDLSQEALVENYWKEVEGTDRKILEAGLKCLQP